MAQWEKNLSSVQETQEMRVRSLGQDDPVEEKMVTHISTLAWKIPWTEKPGRLQSMESQELDMTECLHFLSLFFLGWL